MKKNKFKNITNYIFVILLFSIIYVVLSEEFSGKNFLFGLAISIACIYVTNRYLISDSYFSMFPVDLFKFIYYFCFLIIKIIQSGVNAAILTITNKSKIEFFTFKSELNNDFALNLLANSITLTPGTVTINRDDSSLLIMQLCPLNSELNITDIKIFETKISNMLHRKDT